MRQKTCRKLIKSANLSPTDKRGPERTRKQELEHLHTQLGRLMAQVARLIEDEGQAQPRPSEVASPATTIC